jgi:hypothetical protein
VYLNNDATWYWGFRGIAGKTLRTS